ncbi:PRC-barrel domain-containing protein [Phenylobacterium sp. LjRoot219]|uniref:PRC-barrel domain-containing protein n=1 Tax=Phenylobacterium sp. LjRoot219 TaxID=3342283 RepID=UPI003ECFAE1A
MKYALICAVVAICAAPSLALAQADALGLTRGQLEDADLVDLSGREIGEVEGVVTDADGRIIGLLVELDQRDPTPDKLVQIPLDGLKAVPEPGDPRSFDIQTRQSAAELMKLPPASTTSRPR